METSSQPSEGSQEQQMALLEDLADCLDRERQVLVDLDIPALWTVVEEKHGILQAIEALPVKKHPITTCAEAGISSGAMGPPMKTSREHRIDRLKAEIRERARENAAFIQDSLAFVDKLIGLFAGNPAETETYRPHGEERRAGRGPIYRREV